MPPIASANYYGAPLLVAVRHFKIVDIELSVGVNPKRMKRAADRRRSLYTISCSIPLDAVWRLLFRPIDFLISFERLHRFLCAPFFVRFQLCWVNQARIPPRRVYYLSELKFNYEWSGVRAFILRAAIDA